MQLGGYYIKPFTFIHKDALEHKNYTSIEFWEKYVREYGTVIIDMEHESKISRNFEGLEHLKKYKSRIRITIDGLMFTEVPNVSDYIDDSLNILEIHLNSFIATMNLAGWYFNPFWESNLQLVIEKDNDYSLGTYPGTDYNFLPQEEERYMDRYALPYDPKLKRAKLHSHTYNYMEPDAFRGYYERGLQISKDLGINSEALILNLNAIYYFSIRNWNASLLLGWGFIESVIQCIWNKKILIDKIGDQKERLKDNRTYSASVKLEIIYNQSLISLDLYNYLHSLRKMRNDLIHSGKGVFRAMIDGMFPSTNELIEVLSSIASGINRQGGTYLGGWIKDKKYREKMPQYRTKFRGKTNSSD